MKKRMIRLLTVLAIAALAVVVFAISASAESAEGSKLDGFAIYAGTQVSTAGTQVPGWQTPMVGEVDQCPKSIKLWQGDNGLWLNFEYYHDPYAIKPLEIRLRADKWNGIATVRDGRIVASPSYFAGSDDERLIADFGDAYGWHHISVKINQDVTVEGGHLRYSWDATFSIDGGTPVTFVGDPACLGVGAEVGMSPVWKLYDAALSPDGGSVDFERASASPSTNTFLRFYFYGGGFYNNGESERSLLRIRNVHSYYGDSAETVYGVKLLLGGGALAPNAVTDAVCSVTGSYIAKAYHKSYDTYEYSYFVHAGKSVTLPTPERKGFRFTGWYADAGCTERVSSISNASASTALYAGWEPTATVIVYQLDGGSPAAGVTYPTELAWGSSSISLPQPTKTNHEFLGWIVNGEGQPIKSETVPFSASASSPTVTLTAVWRRVTGSVRFVVPSELSLSGDTAATFAINRETDIVFPTVSGEGFAGWYLSADYSGERITSYRTVVDNPDLVFYAKYEKLFCDYDFSDGTAKPPVQFYNALAANGVAELRDGALHWKVVEGACSSDLPLSVKPKAKDLVIEFAIKGRINCSAGEVRLRLRSSSTANDTTFLLFDGNEMKIGASVLGTFSETEYSSVRLVLTYVSGGVSVDGYLNGQLVVENEMVASSLGPVDNDSKTVETTRFNWYVGLSSSMEIDLDYFYISEGHTPKYTA